MAADLTAIRKEYERAGLAERDADPSPVVQLERWLHDAIEAEHPEPTAMTLATVSPSGEPSARIVLLKTVDHGGLVFFTNYESAKGRDLEANPRACACIHWVLLERQVRVFGPVSRVSREESQEYFAARPRESQLGAWASKQSSVLAGREEIARRLEETRARFGDGPVPCPPSWGGYRLVPDRVEFWQGRPSRLHDRLQYTRIEGERWRIERLSP
jgi:pyridoxamine 5'-phosphate oxidase